MTTTLSRKRPMPAPIQRFFGSSLPWRETWLDDLFGEIMSREENGWLTDQMNATMDVTETDKTIEVRMDLPGIDVKDINIDVNENSMTISGCRKEEYLERDQRKFHRMERRVGSFSRSVMLPTVVNRDEATAEFKNGVLKVTLPKIDELNSTRIPVKS